MGRFGSSTRWLLALGAGLLYYALARVGLNWADVLAGWPAAITVFIAASLAVSQAHDWPVTLGAAAAGALGATVGGTLLRRGRGAVSVFDPTFRRTRDVILYFVNGAILPAAIVASLEAVAMNAGGAEPLSASEWADRRKAFRAACCRYATARL